MNSKMNLYFIQTKRIKPGEYINFLLTFLEEIKFRIKHYGFEENNFSTLYQKGKR
jgi:hypothetical protein